VIGRIAVVFGGSSRCSVEGKGWAEYQGTELLSRKTAAAGSGPKVADAHHRGRETEPLDAPAPHHLRPTSMRGGWSCGPTPFRPGPFACDRRVGPAKRAPFRWLRSIEKNEGADPAHQDHRVRGQKATSRAVIPGPANGAR